MTPSWYAVEHTGIDGGREAPVGNTKMSGLTRSHVLIGPLVEVDDAQCATRPI